MRTLATSAPPNRSPNRVPRAVVAVLLLFVLLAALYHAAVPLGEGPDEPGHMGYVLFLARAGRLPVQHPDPTRSEVPGEGHQPPLAYLLALPAVAWLPATAPPLDQSANPAFRWNGGSEPAAFLRASREYWPWQGATLAWHLARGISALWGLATLICIWGSARALFARGAAGQGPAEPAAGPAAGQRAPERVALLAVALVAFNPQFLFTTALVTNDALLAALSAALCWLVLATPAASARPLVWTLGAGGLVGLALLTKQSALLLAPLLIWPGWRLGGGDWRRTLLLVAAAVGTALLLAGPWYLRNWHIYGDPFGLAAFQATYATQPFAWHTPAAWLSGLARLAASCWAYFGWISLPAPTWLLLPYAALTLAALAGLFLRLLCARWLPLVPFLRRHLPAFARSPWLPLLLLPLLALAWVISFALLAGHVAWQGRQLVSALPALAILLAWGLLALPGIGRQMRLLLATAGVLALAAPIAVIAPAYPWHTLPPDLAQARSPQPAYARYAKPWEQGVELRGWHTSRAGQPLPPGTRVRPGQAISLTLTWHALERVPHDWTIFLHLVDAQGQIVAEDNRRPQPQPLPLWAPGDWIETNHPLYLPADLPPDCCTLRVGLYLPWQRNPRAGRRQEVWARTGAKLGDLAEVGRIDIAPE